MRAGRYRKIKFAMLFYGVTALAMQAPDAKVKRKFTVTLPTEASRYFKGQRGNLIRVSDPDNYVGVFITLGYPRLYFVG